VGAVGARAGAGLEEVEVGEGGLVEDHGVGGRAEADAADVVGVAAEVLDDVVQEGAGGPGGGGMPGAAEAVEGGDAEMAAEAVVGRGGLEGPVVADGDGEGAGGAQGGQEFDVGGEGFGDEDFGGGLEGDVAEDGIGGRGVLHPEFAGGKLEEGEAVEAAGAVDAGEVVRAGGLEHGVLEERAGRENGGDAALDDALGGGGVLELVAEGNLAAGAEDLRGVDVDRVVGHAAHRDALALGERDAQELGAEDRVVEEHLEEVAETEEEHGVAVELRLRAAVLKHHGRVRVGHGGGILVRGTIARTGRAE